MRRLQKCSFCKICNHKSASGDKKVEAIEMDFSSAYLLYILNYIAKNEHDPNKNYWVIFAEKVKKKKNFSVTFLGGLYIFLWNYWYN